MNQDEHDAYTAKRCEFVEAQMICEDEIGAALLRFQSRTGLRCSGVTLSGLSRGELKGKPHVWGVCLRVEL